MPLFCSFCLSMRSEFKENFSTSHHPPKLGDNSVHLLLPQLTKQLDIVKIQLMFRASIKILKQMVMGLPGGTVVKNPPASAGDMGSSPSPGRSHMPRSN